MTGPSGYTRVALNISGVIHMVGGTSGMVKLQTRPYGSVSFRVGRDLAKMAGAALYEVATVSGIGRVTEGGLLVTFEIEEDSFRILGPLISPVEAFAWIRAKHGRAIAAAEDAVDADDAAHADDDGGGT